MTLRLATLTAVAVAVLVAAAFAGQASADRGVGPPKPAGVSGEGSFAYAVVGSYCVSGDPGKFGVQVTNCGDAPPWQEPEPTHTIPVAPRMRLGLAFFDVPDLQDEVEKVTARLVRIGANGEARYFGKAEVRDAGDSWRVVLPQKLHRANGLELSVRMNGGDMENLVGLDVTHRQPISSPLEPGTPVKAAELRGLTVDEAEATVSGAGCTLRVVKIDGAPQAITDDLRWDRVNVSIRDGRVAGVVGIF